MRWPAYSQLAECMLLADDEGKQRSLGLGLSAHSLYNEIPCLNAESIVLNQLHHPA